MSFGRLAARSHARLMRFVLTYALAASLLFVSSSALAADPMAPAEPAPDPVPPPADCALDLHAGVEMEDVTAIALVVCAEVRQKLPAGPLYRVRVARLGSKIVLSLATLGQPERQLVLSSLDEVPVAAPRLVDAMRAGTPPAETTTVTNVVGGETRTHKKKSGEIHAWLGMVGATVPGPTVATGAGVSAGLSVGSDRWSFVGDLRGTGGDVKLVALSGGVRHHFGSSDTTPFATMGIALASVDAERKNTSDLDGGGLVVFGELGLDVLRTSQFGGAIVFRADVPAFEDNTPILSGALAMRF
jgi:hypothetical protein